jgi:hypothetical protein
LLITSVAVTCLPVLILPAVARAAPPDDQPVAPIELRDVVVGGRHGHEILRDVAYQNGAILDGARLYHALGRDDLARTYESRKATAVVLVTTGLLGIIGGLATAASDKPHDECELTSTSVGPFGIPSQTSQCHTVGGGTTFGVGIGSAVLGTMLAIVGAALDPEPVPKTERRRLVEEYNASLATTPPSARLELAPVFSLAGGGLSLRAHF